MKLGNEAKVILGAVFFAFIPVFIKMSPDSDLYVLLFGRLFFACIILMTLKEKLRLNFRLKLKEALLLFVWALIMFLAMISYFVSITISGMGISSALLGTQPLIIVLLSWVILRERITWRTLIALIIMLFGLAKLLNLSDLASIGNQSGDFLAIISAILLAINYIFHKRYLIHFSTSNLLFYQCLFQLPLLLPFLMASTPVVSVKMISASFLLGLLCTVLAYGLIYSGAKNISTQKIGVLQSIEYVLPILFGFLFYKEPITFRVLIGIVLIFISCYIIQLKRFPQF